ESSSTTIGAHMKATAEAVHGAGLEFIWIPFYDTTTGVQDWRTYGFDRVSLQPNYAFKNVTTQRFAQVDTLVKSAGLAGIEYELGASRNSTIASSADPELTNAKAYFEQAITHGFTTKSLSTYYNGNVIDGYATSGTHREIYDDLHRNITLGPRRR